MESGVSEKAQWGAKSAVSVWLSSETGVSVFEQLLRVGRLLGPTELRSEDNE